MFASLFPCQTARSLVVPMRTVPMRTRRSHPINPGAPAHRQLLRVLGFVLVATGGVFAVVGFVDFFGAFGGRQPPQKFWCLFVGLPLLGLGGALLKFGYVGEISRYVAGETAPVATDTFNYVAEGVRPGIRHVSEALRAGRSGGGSASPMTCGACGADHDADARYCDACGVALRTDQACGACGAENDAAAQFCDACGKALARVAR